MAFKIIILLQSFPQDFNHFKLGHVLDFLKAYFGHSNKKLILFRISLSSARICAGMHIVRRVTDYGIWPLLYIGIITYIAINSLCTVSSRKP